VIGGSIVGRVLLADQLNTGSHLLTAGEEMQVFWFGVEHELKTTIDNGLVPTYNIDSAGQYHRRI